MFNTESNCNTDMMTPLMEVKITYCRHTPVNSKLTLHWSMVIQYPFRITALWWISVLFTTRDKFTTIFKTHHNRNSPHPSKMKKKYFVCGAGPVLSLPFRLNQSGNQPTPHSNRRRTTNTNIIFLHRRHPPHTQTNKSS